MDPHGGQPVVQRGAPLGKGRAVMLLVHGRNAGPENILELTAPLAHPDFTFLAPAAAGRTWYPESFLAPIPRNEPWLSSALRRLASLTDEIEAAGVPRQRMVLLGFSQGGCLASEYAIRHGSRLGGLVTLSGGLIGPPGTTWEYPGGFDGMPVFLGCSDRDPHVPRERVEESAEVFERRGARVTLRIYPGLGHQVSADELDFVRGLMREIAAAD